MGLDAEVTMLRFMWRIRYTIYGVRRTRLSVRLWWSWSVNAYEHYSGMRPTDAAADEIYYII